MTDYTSWLDVLWCPQCHADLTYDANEPAYHCTGCGGHYPIINGVPRFANVPQEAHVERTVQNFGKQWQQSNTTVQSTRLGQKDLFLDFIHPVQPEHFTGKLVLDGGCGQGRFTQVAQQFGAGRVLGVDLSAAVEVAAANTAAMDNVLIIQADLLKLPVRPVVDYAFSVGVLHHTADPAGSFASVAGTVKPDGTMSAWVYGRENNGWIIHVLDPIRINVTSRLPNAVLWGISYLLAAILYVMVTVIYLPVENNPRLHGLRRFLFYPDYLLWLRQHAGYRETALVVFDHLTPQIAEYIPRDEFETWFVNNHFTDRVITPKANNSWRGFARKVTGPV
ncbi:MAG: methyltransferase domain-containing protein [Chloroflexota bacterium]